MTFQTDTEVAEVKDSASQDGGWGGYDWDARWREHEEVETLKCALHGPEWPYIPQPGDEEYEWERYDFDMLDHEARQWEAHCEAEGRDPKTGYCLDEACECCPSPEEQRAERAEERAHAAEWEAQRLGMDIFMAELAGRSVSEQRRIQKRPREGNCSGLRGDGDLVLSWHKRLDATLAPEANEDHRRAILDFYDGQQERLERRHAGVAEQFHPDHSALELVKDGIPVRFAAVTGDDLHVHRLRLEAQGMYGFQVGRRMRVVLGFFDWAHDITYLPVNPAADYRRRCLGPDRYL